MEAVGRLAGGIAHDFNNILSVILSYAEMMGATPEPGERYRSDLKESRTAGLRATELTRQLLAFSRQQVIEPKVLKLNDTLAGLEKMLRRLLGEDVDLTTLLASGLWNIKADAGHRRQHRQPITAFFMWPPVVIFRRLANHQHPRRGDRDNAGEPQRNK